MGADPARRHEGRLAGALRPRHDDGAILRRAGGREHVIRVDLEHPRAGANLGRQLELDAVEAEALAEAAVRDDKSLLDVERMAGELVLFVISSKIKYPCASLVYCKEINKL